MNGFPDTARQTSASVATVVWSRYTRRVLGLGILASGGVLLLGHAAAALA